MLVLSQKLTESNCCYSKLNFPKKSKNYFTIKVRFDQVETFEDDIYDMNYLFFIFAKNFINLKI